MDYDKNIRLDGYMNMLTKAGTWKDSSESYIYQPDIMTPDAELAQIYASNGLFVRIIDKPSELALKNGFDFKVGNKDINDYLIKKLNKLKWSNNAIKAEKWARLFGGAAILMCIDDGGGWDDPVDAGAAVNIDGLIVFERPEITPDYNSIMTSVPDPSRIDRFARPEYYMITPMYGGSQFRVHESRLLIFRNGEAPRSSTTNTNYMFFGIPEYDRIKRELRNTITSHGNGYRMLERCVQAVFKMSNLSEILATETGEDDVIRRMQLIDMARSLLNTMVIDADGEDYAFQSFTLTGVKEIVDESCNMLSAVTNIPQTVLFGRSPAGMNSTGDSDLSNYYDYIGQIQNLDIVDNLHRLVDIVLITGKNRGDIVEIPEHEVVPLPLWNLSEKERAELEQSKAQAELTKAQATQVYVDMQVLDPQEVRRTIAETNLFQIEDVLSEEDLQEDEAAAGTLMRGETDAPGNIAESGDFVKIQELDGDFKARTQHDSSGRAGKEGVGVIVVRDGKILCGTRSDNLQICGPGGHIEDGETPSQAAARETGEEFGIVPKSLVPIGKTTGSGGCLPAYVFLTTEFSGNLKADADEMYGARWESLEALKTERMFPAFEESLEILTGALTGHGNFGTVVNRERIDGGPGSGRYPKGSGSSRRKGGRKKQLKMSKAEFSQVNSEVNSLYHSLYKGEPMGVHKTFCEDRQEYCEYHFEISGFNSYRFYGRRKIKR